MDLRNALLHVGAQNPQVRRRLSQVDLINELLGADVFAVLQNLVKLAENWLYRDIASAWRGQARIALYDHNGGVETWQSRELQD